MPMVFSIPFNKGLVVAGAPPSRAGTRNSTPERNSAPIATNATTDSLFSRAFCGALGGRTNFWPLEDFCLVAVELLVREGLADGGRFPPSAGGKGTAAAAGASTLVQQKKQQSGVHLK